MTLECVIDAELFKKYSTDNKHGSFIETIKYLLDKGHDDSTIREANCLFDFLRAIANGKGIIYYNEEIINEYLQYFDKLPLDLIDLIQLILSNEKCSRKITGSFRSQDFEYFENTALKDKLVYLDVAYSLKEKKIVSTIEDIKNTYRPNARALMKYTIFAENICKHWTGEEIEEEIGKVSKRLANGFNERATGLSTSIASDCWTLDDELGYDAYAYAIYKFLIHKETKPPLTISIQAPWGGGKTSLMRMIQERLDPKVLEKYKEYQKRTLDDKSDKERTKNKLTIDHVRDELKILTQGKKPEFKIPDEYSNEDQRLTIWFNVWKYESTEQVWAGLADAIISQFGERLGPIEREKFWLHLQLRRLNPDKIRHTIYKHILTILCYNMFPWLVGSLVALVILSESAIRLNNPLIQNVGWSITGIVLVIKAIIQHQDVKKEPAEISLSEYIHVPDYSTKLGFVHSAEEDLQRVLDVITKPIVIFIDDLDRCSPDKVADLVEAINLFLAGEFKNCIFVLGMDPEIVAASLEEAHNKVIAKLPADAKNTPIGWRFMDKFVQLPFVIPQADRNQLDNYVKSLLSEYKKKEQIDEQVNAAASEVLPKLEDLNQIEKVSQELTQKYNLNENQQRYLAQKLTQNVSFNIMDRGIASFSDQNSDIRDLVLKTAPEFSRNPRDLKRFLNMFRFLFFLKWAREGRGKTSPSLEQLRRWIMFSMKWPEVERWLRYSYNRGEGWILEEKTVSTNVTRLRLLEDIGAKSKNMEEWLSETKDMLQLTVEKAAWVADDDLRKFFQNEGSFEEKDRLSAASEMGFW